MLNKLITAAGLMLIASPALAIEEPPYEVLRRTNDYEIRRYEPYIVAQTVVDQDFRQAGGSAFRVLADYIFGGNSRSEVMAMTSPVISHSMGGSGRYVYAFVMESEYTLKTLPGPLDGRVVIREIPEHTVAAHRFSGGWDQKNYRAHETRLAHALERDGIEVVGTYAFARYNAPMTPSFMRRNEVMVQVAAD